MKVDALQTAVVAALDDVDGSCIAEGRDSPWTEAVLKALSQTGQKLGFYVCAAGKPPGARHGEWLWDCTWLDYEGDDPHKPLRLAPMVAECEWKGSVRGSEYLKKILYDFEKLLVANAPLRVMVFEKTSEFESSSIAKELLCRVRHMEAVADDEVRYLLVAWEQFEKPTFRYFRITVDQCGAKPSWYLHEGVA